MALGSELLDAVIVCKPVSSFPFFVLENHWHTIHSENFDDSFAFWVVVFEHELLDFWEYFSNWFALDLSSIGDPLDNGAHSFLVKICTLLQEWHKLPVPVVVVDNSAVGLPVFHDFAHSSAKVLVFLIECLTINIGLSVVEVNSPLWVLEKTATVASAAHVICSESFGIVVSARAWVRIVPCAIIPCGVSVALSIVCAVCSGLASAASFLGNEICCVIDTTVAWVGFIPITAISSRVKDIQVVSAFLKI
jgi:hypothetical protein